MATSVSNRTSSDLALHERGRAPRGPVYPRLDLSRISAHLPQPQRVRIEINGCLCGTPVAIPDAVPEFAAGWAFANRFYDAPHQVSKVSSSSTHVSLMVEGGCDLDRRKYEAIGWIEREDLAMEHDVPHTERVARAVPLMSELEAVHAIETAFERYEGDGSRAGYVHAGLVTVDETVCIARDLGGEAAFHKVLGWALTTGFALENSMLVTRGIIDEAVCETAARAGIPVVVSDAVPTAAAVALAQMRCVTLIGLARSTRRGMFVDGGHLGDPIDPDWEDLFGAI